MSSHPVIDADGHIIEDKEKLRSYLNRLTIDAAAP